MASVFKQTRKKPIPKGATTVDRRGKRIVEWDSRGRNRRAEVTPDGKAMLVVDPNYTVMWFDWTGKRCKVSGGPDKDAAEQLGAKFEAEEMQRRRGLIDPRQEKLSADGRRPLQEHTDDFRLHLESKGDTPDYVALVSTRLQSVVAGCGFERLSDLVASPVQRFIAGLRDSKSLRTCNGYLRAIKGFSRWAWNDGRAAADPLVSLQAYNEQTDRRRVRRALDADEFRRLVIAAEARCDIEGVSGVDRAMMYILSAWTGFRRKELASLTIRSFSLAAEPPTVTVQAAHSKRRREDTQVLHPVVVELFRIWLAARPTTAPDSTLFNLRTAGGYWRKTGKMMKADLAAARLAWIDEARTEQEHTRREESDYLTYQDEDGMYADFHSHRHSFISNLGKAGVPLTTAQKLARHCDPKLTANVYTHLEIADQAAAVNLLPSPPQTTSGIEKGEQLLKATGTDDSQAARTYVELKGEHLGEQSGGSTRQNVAAGGNTRGVCAEETDRPQTVSLSMVGKEKPPLASGGNSGDERARTVNPRLAKPVLSQLSYVPLRMRCGKSTAPKRRGVVCLLGLFGRLVASAAAPGTARP